MTGLACPNVLSSGRPGPYPLYTGAGRNATRLCSVRAQYGAAGRAIARLVVYVQAGKAVRAVVAVPASRAIGDDLAPADLAGENLIAGVALVIVFFVFFCVYFPGSWEFSS